MYKHGILTPPVSSKTQNQMNSQDKIGYALINQILFGVTPKNQKRSKRGDTEELGHRVKM